MDGFDQDECRCEGEGLRVVSCGLLTSYIHALEPLQFADGLFDPDASLVENFRKECGLVDGGIPVWDRRVNAPVARRLAIAFGVVAFVGEGRARCDVRADINERFEVSAVICLAAGQMKGDWEPVEIGLEMNFRREAAARTPEGLIVLPPFAPAAETCARKTVETNI